MNIKIKQSQVILLMVVILKMAHRKRVNWQGSIGVDSAASTNLASGKILTCRSIPVVPKEMHFLCAKVV
jgi:hypothetical protein